ncbi:uncharacterized protein LOC143550580 [Bidens hawaiensis]|uniref:uncharacterized protein LOC143550580 n=1 Tax=Bidens hawaiensis TaxID=980011 RepID=UPI00404A89FE
MDPHSFSARAEAQRWLGIAEKLLIGNDLVGSKTFAIRARESDPRLEAADQILAITDTLLAADKRVVGHNGTQQPDFYAILQLVRFAQDSDHIAAQYRRLAVALNPHQNRFPYSDQAFQLVNDAYSVLSNPIRKSMYDADIDFVQPQINNLGFNIEPQQQHHEHHQQQQQHNFFSMTREPEFQPRVVPPGQGQQLHQHNFLSQNSVGLVPVAQLFQQQTQPFQVTVTPLQHNVSHMQHQQAQSPPAPPAPPQPPFSWPQQLQQQFQQQQHHESPQQAAEAEIEPEAEAEAEAGIADEGAKDNNDSTFWTTCPYCFYLYEYPSEYVECVLRCDTCKRAFQAVSVPSPPAIAEDKDSYYCCWGFFPLAVSVSDMQKNNVGGKKTSNWAPFSPMCDVSIHVPDNVKSGHLSDEPDLDNVNDDHLNDEPAPKKNAFVNTNLGPPIYIDDEVDDIFEGISEPSEDSDLEWNDSKKKKAKKMKKDKLKDVRNGNSRKSVGVTTRRQSGRAPKEMGRLDLNVEFDNNEGEEVIARRGGGTRGGGQGDGDNAEGIGFFEGLDEFFSSLPILSVVNDDKVKAG